MRAGRVEPPFEDISVDDDSVGQFAVAMTLLDRTDVDNQGTGCPDGCEVGWFNPVEPATALLEQVTDSGPIGVLHVPRR